MIGFFIRIVKGVNFSEIFLRFGQIHSDNAHFLQLITVGEQIIQTLSADFILLSLI